MGSGRIRFWEKSIRTFLLRLWLLKGIVLHIRVYQDWWHIPTFLLTRVVNNWIELIVDLLNILKCCSLISGRPTDVAYSYNEII